MWRYDIIECEMMTLTQEADAPTIKMELRSKARDNCDGDQGKLDIWREFLLIGNTRTGR